MRVKETFHIPNTWKRKRQMMTNISNGSIIKCLTFGVPFLRSQCLKWQICEMQCFESHFYNFLERGGSIFRAIETRGIAQAHYSPTPAHWTQQRARTSTSHANDRLLQRRLKPCTLIFYLYFVLFFLSLK